jgi:tetratricopeptide (TPR) repeat protein
MNKQNIFYTLIGLLAGFILGFFLANSINRNASMQSPTTAGVQINSGAPFSPASQNNPQAQSADIKEPSSTGMIPEVAETISKAQNEPNNFSAQIKAGEMYLRIQNLEKANEFIRRAVAAHQDNFPDLATLGNAYFDTRNYEEAEKWYLRALEKNPNDVDVRTDLGSTFMERAQPDFDRAIKEYRTSLEKNPNHENTLFNLSLALFRKGDMQGVQSTIARLEELNPQSPLIPKLKERLIQPAPK